MEIRWSWCISLPYVCCSCFKFIGKYLNEFLLRYCGFDHWLNIMFKHMRLHYIPRNMHTVFALLCFVVVIHWLIFPYPSGLLHWHCGNQTIAPVPAKQPWWIWINTSCEFIMNDCITTTKQSTTKPCAYFLGCTVVSQYEIISGQYSSSNICRGWPQWHPKHPYSIAWIDELTTWPYTHNVWQLSNLAWWRKTGSNFGFVLFCDQ